MLLIGVPIGLYGYLFPGNINLMVLEIYRSGKSRFLFAILSLILIFESFYCIASLTLLESIKSNQGVYHSIESFSYIMIFLMGLWMLFEKKRNKINSYKNTIYRGVLSIIIHPQQIPFWIIAGVLINRFTHPTENHITFLLFVLFNAIGTTLAMLIYMFVGNRIIEFFKFNIAQVNKVMGGIYILMVLYHLNHF
jgi:threonine/homoserine/homoserine lactone efflux protein